MSRRRGQQAQDRPAQHRFAAAGFADDAERLAGADSEGDMSLAIGCGPAVSELDHEVGDLAAAGSAPPRVCGREGRQIRHTIP